ncbi:potassium channel subfamily K member 18-like isoform X2 [Zootermopsis nevadensis]|uniref:potassium channel subfamily K member 18-like isoform X2 n=1 Tax=Zootermopsis nevadensis TaxID=136037 RepID=UPI000B8E50EA|nr:potassium channel subfamily K member 18-like isoform X2 [Zootermopsis nevadensis]
MPAATRNVASRSRQCNPARVRRCLRIFFGHLFSNLGLFSLVVGYVLLGALLFEFLEAGYELEQRGHIQQYREECLKELWLITERLNVLYEKNWTHLVHEQLRKFETNVVAATKVEGYDGKDLADSDRQWSFSGALLYSVTVITTIGYGNLAPKTPEGKLVTMLYALIGVPLMLLCLSNLGTVLAGTFQFAYSHACCYACSKNNNQPEHKNQCYHSMSRPPSCAQPLPVDSSPVTARKAPPVVPVVHVSRVQSRPRPPRPLTPEARQILTECAEYSLAQEGGAAADPAAAKLLQELRRQDPEALEVDEVDDLEDADQEQR